MLSASALATTGRIEGFGFAFLCLYELTLSGGGIYYLLSRNLGSELGAAIGILFSAVCNSIRLYVQNSSCFSIGHSYGNHNGNFRLC